MVQRKYLFSFREANGDGEIDVLHPKGVEFPELVDPDSGDVVHTGSLVMHDREWRIGAVDIGETLVTITFVPIAASNDRNASMAARTSGG